MKMDSFRTIKINSQRKNWLLFRLKMKWRKKETGDVEKNQYDYFVYATCANPRLPHNKKPMLSLQNVWSLGSNILP